MRSVLSRVADGRTARAFNAWVSASDEGARLSAFGAKFANVDLLKGWNQWYAPLAFSLLCPPLNFAALARVRKCGVAVSPTPLAPFLSFTQDRAHQGVAAVARFWQAASGGGPRHGHQLCMYTHP